MKANMLKIKPVAKGVFKSSRVTLRDIAQYEREGVAIFATRANPDGTETDVFLLAKATQGLKAGNFYSAEHADTRRKYGDHIVLGVMPFKFKQGLLHVDGYDVGTAAYSELFDLEAVAFQLV